MALICPQMSEVTDKISEQLEHSQQSKLNSAIAIVVAISASLIALFNIKDNNIVQAMSQAQAHSIDAWAYYQAKGTKQNLAEATRDSLEVQLSLNPNVKAETKQKIEKLIQHSQSQIEKYEKEKVEIKAKAEGYQTEYDQLNIHDDQFDLAEALISLGISIFGITALTQKKPLFYFGLVLSGIGVVFGFAGFLGLALHPEFLTKLLG